MVTTSIDAETCTRCATCASECPTGAITLAEPPGDLDPPPPVVGDGCFGCGHCGAVCPTGSVRSTEGDYPPWRAPRIASDEAKALLTGRRSVRRYRPEPLERDLLEELLSVAPFAPTASNAQDVHATVVTGERVFELAAQVNDYYVSFEVLLRRWYLWPILCLRRLVPTSNTRTRSLPSEGELNSSIASTTGSSSRRPPWWC